MEAKATHWTEIWLQNISRVGWAGDMDYWNKRAEDYNDLIVTSRFNYGEEIVRILNREGVIGSKDTVLEIAGGVGAVTIPLARAAHRVITIEPAFNMIRRLEQNAEKAGLSNIDIKIGTQDYFEEEIPSKNADLVILCHAAGEFPDIERLFHFMDRVSRRHCCLADSLPHMNQDHQALFEKLGIAVNKFDHVTLLYNLLWETGACPDMVYFDFTMRRSIASAIQMLTHVAGKYREVIREDVARIEDHVTARASAGIYEAPGRMGVIWWKSEAWSWAECSG